MDRAGHCLDRAGALARLAGDVPPGNEDFAATVAYAPQRLDDASGALRAHIEYD
jgi:hypothetical protein